MGILGLALAGSLLLAVGAEEAESLTVGLRAFLGCSDSAGAFLFGSLVCAWALPPSAHGTAGALLLTPFMPVLPVWMSQQPIMLDGSYLADAVHDALTFYVLETQGNV